MRNPPLPSRTLASLASLTLLALALAGCGGQKEPLIAPRTDANGDLRYGELAFKPCSLGGEGGGDAVEAQCASLEVPENHAAPGGRRIKLAIALIASRSQTENDPLVFIAGGPGQSILQSYPMLHDALEDARRNRNVLLVDARGTGGSHPLQCDEFLDLGDDAASGDLALMRTLVTRCRDRLGKDTDLRFYGTADHIRDLDLVRAKIGVDRLNLIGISYGTRVAQQYARRYPQHVRTATLDSIAPNTLVLGQEHARNLDAAVRRQFERCVADAACKRRIGDPAALLAGVRAKLQASGLAPVRYREQASGDWREETPTFGHLANLLRMYAYRPESASMLPLILHDASEGRYEPLLSQSRSIGGDMTDALAIGMSLSVSCTEDFEIKPDPRDENTILGNDFAEYMAEQCKLWPKGERAADFRKPLTGDLPVLAISGEFDPVTPPRYGDEVVKTLPNGRHLVLPGQGHSVLTTGCMPKLFAQFIEKADAKALDAGCLKRLKPTPPFTGYYGWEP